MKTLLARSPCLPSARNALLRFVPISLLVAGLAAGQDSAQEVANEVDEMFRWVTPSTPGCAVAVAQDGEMIVLRAYGSADLENDIPVTPNTVFDVGSLTKQFVAAAVLLLAEDERLSLSDDVRKYFPELPDYGPTITVDHLLTHTSGVRDWTGLQRMSSEDEDALTMVLRQRGLNFAPGEEWSYSNSGYVLLKELVARITEMPFSEFAHRRLFEPLGMEATTYADDLREGRENLAIGYQREGDRWKEDVLVGNERGGGGALLSTVIDLTTWNDALDSARLGAFVSEKLEEPAKLNNGRELRYARGLSLFISPVRRVVWHSGSAGGYKSLCSRLPEHGLSVVVLSNAGDSAERTGVSRRIFDLLAPDTASEDPDAALSGSTVAPVTDLRGKAGLFFNEAGAPMRLIVQGTSLGIAGGPVLVPIAAERFRNPEPTLSFLSQDEFELQFSSNDQFELESMEGQTTLYHRAQPGAPTEAGLDALAGRYESEELRATLEVRVEEGRLLIRMNGSQELAFAAADRDTFQFGPILVRFRRDEDGRVIGLEFSNPVLRNVPFAR